MSLLEERFSPKTECPLIIKLQVLLRGLLVCPFFFFFFISRQDGGVSHWSKVLDYESRNHTKSKRYDIQVTISKN